MRKIQPYLRRSSVPLLLALILAACSGDAETRGSDRGTRTPSSDSSSASEPPSDEPTSNPSASPSGDEPSGEGPRYQLWFVQGDKLVLEHRTGAATQAVAKMAMESLLGGPLGPEAESGDTTAIPESTALRGISIEDGIATVDLSSEFDSGGGSATMFLRLAQVVFTLTQFPTVEAVEFWIEGEPVNTFSSEGIVLEGPQTRSDYERHLPPIVVEQPVPGEEVPGSLVVSGTANVFEATVSIKVIDEKGKVIAEEFTTATCGTGCRGDFETTISLDIDPPASLILKVFESSAEDGRPMNVVRVPFTLVP